MEARGLEFNEAEIMAIKDAIEGSSLCSRVVSLIVHGSCLYFPLESGGKDHDIDLELILDSAESADYEVIREIIDSVDVKVECQLRYLCEISDTEGLIFRSSYKMFMYFAYANGIVLLGRNVYQELINGISEPKLKQSLLISIQIAFKDIRKGFLRRDSDYEVNKRIMETFRLICMFDGSLDWRKLGSFEYFQHQANAFVPFIADQYRGQLEGEDIENLEKFERYYQSKKVFPEIFHVVNKIVQIFSDNLKKGGGYYGKT